MKMIYVQLPYKEPKAIHVTTNTGRALRQAIRDGHDELKGKRLTSISFVGYVPGELSESFYDKYSSPTKPLQVTYLNSVDNVFSSLSDTMTFTSQGFMVDLAKRLKVSPKIYVRECYDKIWTMYIEYEKEQKRRQINHPQFIPHAYLTGTPGIGKTAFLPYFMHRLLKDKRQVIFGSRDIKGFIHWKSIDEHSFIKENDIEPYLWKSEIFFLMDSRDIGSTLGPCVICSSPRADIADQFRKTAKKLYMPVWDWHEIQSLHQAIYPDIISKYLFEQTDQKAAIILKYAIDQSEPSHFQKLYLTDGSSAHEEVSHRLIHQDSVSEISLKYASPYVSTLIVEKYQTIRRDMVIQWLDETSELGKAGGLRGNLFEDIGHSILRKGGSFSIRNLDNNGPEETKTIPAKDLYFVVEKTHGLATKVWTSQYYYKPLSKIFECIDSWMVIDGETWGFQFTVSKSHKISTAVYWLYENLNLRHYVTVVYDQSKFKAYAKTDPTQSNKEPFCNFHAPENFNLKQHVMIIDGSSIDFTDLWGLKKAEFQSFVTKPWSNETQSEYEAAFE